MRLFTVGLAFLAIILASTWAIAADAKTEGKIKFQQFCASCHGPIGNGNGPVAAALKPVPANLKATQLSDSELKEVIKSGGPSIGLSSNMAGWGRVLSDQDITNIVIFIRSL